MKQRLVWLWGLGTVAIAAIVAAIAYHAGQTATVVTTVARPDGTVYPGYYYHDGFGPFGLIFPLLFVLFLVFLFRRSWGWGRGYSGYGHGGGHWHHDPHDHPHGDAPTQPPSGTPDQRPNA